MEHSIPSLLTEQPLVAGYPISKLANGIFCVFALGKTHMSVKDFILAVIALYEYNAVAC